MGKHPDAVFGSDKPPANIETIAAQLRAIQPRALTESQFDDVFVLIDYMREQCVKLYDANVLRKEELDARERELVKRERDLAIRLRAVSSAVQVKETAAARLRGYFRR